MTPIYPDVEVQLTGTDGNAFAIIGAVQRGLRQGGHREAADRWVTDALNAESYDDLLRMAMERVSVS